MNTKTLTTLMACAAILCGCDGGDGIAEYKKLQEQYAIELARHGWICGKLGVSWEETSNNIIRIHLGTNAIK